MNIYKIIIYTTTSVIEYTIKSNIDNFDKIVAEKICEENLVLDTIEETVLVTNAINIVCVEIEKLKESPPIMLI